MVAKESKCDMKGGEWGAAMNEIVEELRRFFQKIAQPLSEVLDAAGCREGWLQGELYRWFHKQPQYSRFRVNSLNIGQRRTADFDADTPIPLVGELKIIGKFYERKCITGGSLAAVMGRLDYPICAGDRQLVLGPWGLIPDFFRLLDFAINDNRAAFLILIIDDEGVPEGDLGRALRGINFLSQATEIPFKRGVIRIWDVYRPANTPPMKVM